MVADERIRAQIQSTLQQVAASMQTLLGVGEQVAAHMAMDWAGFKQVSAQQWALMAGEPEWATTRRLDQLRVIDGREILRNERLRRGGRGLVLTSAHMGDYLLGVLRVLQECPPTSVVIVRQLPGSQDELAFRKLEACGHTVQVVRSHSMSGLMSMRRVLAAGGVVVALFDLPGAWGRVGRVRFFGRSQFWTRGPFDLALAAGADLLTFQSRWSGSQPELCVGYLSAGDDPGRSSDVLLRRAVADLAAQLELRAPQWEHWDLLPQFECH